jgi:nitrite reductase/ring-hydroxylating ferredoxin subunit
MVNLSTADPERPFRLLVLRSGERVHAFVNRCAHFSIPLAAKQEHLLFKPHVSLTCNAHYVTYRWEDGVCESGECAGGALMPVPLMHTPQGMVCIA